MVWIDRAQVPFAFGIPRTATRQWRVQVTLRIDAGSVPMALETWARYFMR
jgi:hypothetical protein